MTDKDRAKERAIEYLHRAYVAVLKLPNNKRSGWDKEIRQIAEDISLVG